MFSGCLVKLFYSKKKRIKWNNLEYWYLSYYIIYVICKVGIFGNRNVMGFLKYFINIFSNDMYYVVVLELSIM